MRFARHASVVAFCLAGSSAGGSPMLLATLSGEKTWGGNQTSPGVDGWFTALGYNVETPEDTFSIALFEDYLSAVPVNSLLSVDLTAEAGRDNAFDQFAELLSDGVSNATGMAQSLVFYDELVGTLDRGGEEILEVHVPRFSEYDLFGYRVERIDLHMTYTMMSPGRDLHADGVWTDFSTVGLVEIYGTPIPEPATLTLLALGLLAVSRRRRQ